jgi:aconitate hydratase
MIEQSIFAPGVLNAGVHSLRYTDLPTILGSKLGRMPLVLRHLLENVMRHTSGAERKASVDALLTWLDTGTSEAEIPFRPGRVLMHDTTSTPALVDIAAMRDALAEADIDPTRLNPVLPVDVSVDHSLAVEAYARQDAPALNLQHEIRRNAERYRFLRWASTALHGVRVHPPGTGIMHTINLEQLATVVTTQQRPDGEWAVPDQMLGTDSHTPMVNGIGVLGWGVGGLEAQTVMFGLPTMLRVPDVVGVRLNGALRPGVLATDLALVVTQRLRAIGVSGEFVEFYGPGVSTLAASERCVIANMAPEYGATTGFFGVDARTLDYLRATGRSEDAIALVESFSRQGGLWFDPQATPRYTRGIEIDLATVGTRIAGPRRPQDLLELTQVPQAFAGTDFVPAHRRESLPDFPVAIAAITSCTNTSDPGLLIAAALLARKARRLGLRAAPWVKTSLAPGSPAAASYLARAGLVEDLEAMGFAIVGYGCTTCIGNPGPLPDRVRDAQKVGACKAVAILSGNRNFPGRVHPDVELSFIMSPPLVVAYAIAGDASRDLQGQGVFTNAEGHTVSLAELWPTREEIEAHLRKGLRAADFGRDFAAATANPMWQALEAPATPLFPWDPKSNALRRPPFAAASEGSMLGDFRAHPLLVVGDDVTTDHISPASAIPPDSLVADFLVSRGDRRDDLNVFASRRGNWQVMVRAAFHNKSLVNQLKPGMPVAHTLHAPSGEVMPIWEAADRYRGAGESVVVVAGERYGMGSSRDWAAKGQRLLGIRAVLAPSFERIHRSNLIGMGILPVRLEDGWCPQRMALQTGDRLEIDAAPGRIEPRAPVAVRIVRAGGRVESVCASAAVETRMEISLLRDGGVIPSILKQHLSH